MGNDRWIQGIDDPCKRNVLEIGIWVFPTPGVQGIYRPSSRVHIDSPNQFGRVQTKRKMYHRLDGKGILKGHAKTFFFATTMLDHEYKTV